MEAKSYYVTLRDRSTGELQVIEVMCEDGCPHGMQTFVDGLTDLKLSSPEVINIAEQVPAPNPTAHLA
jgi:hypothetical protein